MRSTRSFVAAALAMFLAGLVVAVTPTSANAADIYRYWAYFTVTDGEFVSQETGPSDAQPTDGSIEAYRYAAPADFTRPNLPRADLAEVNFDTVCADTEAADGQKRVAVLIDYGVEQDAADGATPPQPQALCAQVAEDANGLQVLESVSPQIRTESGSFGPMLCGIEGYPATGCGGDLADEGTPADGEPVDFALPGDDSDSSGAEDDGSNLPLLIGAGVLVLVLAAGGLFLARRNSSGDAA